MVKPIPDEFTAVTPYIVVENAAKALDFYKAAFGAEERFRLAGPDGKLMHAEFAIGGAVVMMTEARPEMGAVGSKNGAGGGIHLYVADVDAVHARAVKAGAASVMAPTDMFWGDRFAKVIDPFGAWWSIATHTQDLTPAEIEANAKAAMEHMAKASAAQKS